MYPNVNRCMIQHLLCTSGSWDQGVFVQILCCSELCHFSEQLGMEYSSLRQEMLSKSPLASTRALSMFCLSRSKVSILLPPSVLLLLLKNCIGPIASLNDVHSLHQLFPFYLVSFGFLLCLWYVLWLLFQKINPQCNQYVSFVYATGRVL